MNTGELAAIDRVPDRPVRRQSGNRKALGPKAERTRRRLLDSAAELFAIQHYHCTSPAHIAERAGVSLATFYQYFADLPSLIMSMAGDRAARWLALQVNDWQPTTGRLGLRQSIRSALQSFADDAPFYRAWEQACAADPRVERLRVTMWASYKAHVAAQLEDGMACGVVRTDIEPREAARALTLLLNRYSYDAIIHDPPGGGLDVDAAADLLTTLWADAIGLREGPAHRTPAGSANA